jgi:membrane protein
MGPEEDDKIVLEPSGTEVATRAGGARRYRKPLKRFRWQDIKWLLVESFNRWNRHNATRLGASLAFYALLSLAPLLLVVVSIAGLVFGHSAAQRQTMQQVEALVGPAAGKAITAFLEGSRNTTHGVVATIVGLLTLLFSASGVVIELRAALNLIWDVPTPDLTGVQMLTSFIKRRLFSFAIVMGMGFLLIISLAISTWLTALGALATSFSGFEAMLLDVLNSLVSFAVIAGLFAVIYKVMPDVRIEWRDVMLGGAVTSLLFTIGKLLLSVYLGRASYSSTYGAAGSVVVLIAWIYYSGQIFFLGAEFTRSFAHRYGSDPNREPQGMVKLASEKISESKPNIITPGGTVASG